MLGQRASVGVERGQGPTLSLTNETEVAADVELPVRQLHRGHRRTDIRRVERTTGLPVFRFSNATRLCIWPLI